MAATPSDPGDLYQLIWTTENVKFEPRKNRCPGLMDLPQEWEGEFRCPTEVNHPNGDAAFRTSKQGDPQRFGVFAQGYSARFEVDKGDKQINEENPDPNGYKGGVRSELAVNTGAAHTNPGAEPDNANRWYAFSTCPAKWDTDKDEHNNETKDSVTQWHQVDDSISGSPPLALLTVGNQWALSVRQKLDGSNNETMDAPFAPFDIDDVDPKNTKNMWTDWVFHVQWSDGSVNNGLIEVWMNGKHIPNITWKPDGTVLTDTIRPNKFKDGHGNYLKFGIYKWPWNDPGLQPPNPPIQRILFYDELRISTGSDGSEASTQRLQVKLGIKDGYLLKEPSNAPVYFIDHGKKRHVADPDTFNNLFRDWTHIDTGFNVNDIDDGLEIMDGSMLVRGVNNPKVYFLDVHPLTDGNGNVTIRKVKRWIVNPATMDGFWFSWDQIHDMPQVELDQYDEGPRILFGPKG